MKLIRYLHHVSFAKSAKCFECEQEKASSSDIHVRYSYFHNLYELKNSQFLFSVIITQSESDLRSTLANLNDQEQVSNVSMKTYMNLFSIFAFVNCNLHLRRKVEEDKVFYKMF